MHFGSLFFLLPFLHVLQVTIASHPHIIPSPSLTMLSSSGIKIFSGTSKCSCLVVFNFDSTSSSITGTSHPELAEKIARRSDTFSQTVSIVVHSLTFLDSASHSPEPRSRAMALVKLQSGSQSLFERTMFTLLTPDVVRSILRSWSSVL